MLNSFAKIILYQLDPQCKFIYHWNRPLDITTDNKDSVEIIISDNGKGFGDENISDLLGSLTRVKSNGSGIGLSIVNEIVKAHGGRFMIGNNSNGGAEFRISLRK